MERHLGRKLFPDEIVHHINGQTKDNRIENLVVVKWGVHNKIEKEVKRIELKCPTCGEKIFLREAYINWKKQHGVNNFYCSRKCACAANGMFSLPIDDVIKKEMKKGMSSYAIGKKYGFNKKTVYNHMKKLRS